jgi:hypothetical protein
MTDRYSEIRSTRAPKLRKDQIEVLSRYGQTRETVVGEVLFRAGDPSSDFIVVPAGDVRSGSIKRVASAVSEGSMAVRLVHQYLADTDV